MKCCASIFKLHWQNAKNRLISIGDALVDTAATLALPDLVSTVSDAELALEALALVVVLEITFLLAFSPMVFLSLAASLRNGSATSLSRLALMS